MSTETYNSWGRYFNYSHRVVPVYWTDDTLFTQAESEKLSVLPFGYGRSYGDLCLNDHGILLVTNNLDRLRTFDRENGILQCEAGVSLETILNFSVPRGWFLPVTPGTKFVTVGGAIANDVHGKNHHKSGTFGRYVKRFELVRSDGKPIICSAEQHSDLFRATIGGLGLTGLITWAEIQLKPITSSLIDCETIRFANLEEFFHLSETSDKEFEYTVAWIDCLATRDSLGRGIFIRGNHLHCTPPRYTTDSNSLSLTIPCNAPEFLLNSLSIKLFNAFYYHRQRRKQVRRHQHYGAFFYPLDKIGAWNRLYGKRGFFQYQLVLPNSHARAIRLILETVADSRLPASLAVLKQFGDIEASGLMSFPIPGITLSLDFANYGQKTFELFQQLDAVVVEHGGRIYPAKDAQMSAQIFQQSYPAWREFKDFVDPLFSSSFWRRVTPSP